MYSLPVNKNTTRLLTFLDEFINRLKGSEQVLRTDIMSCGIEIRYLKNCHEHVQIFTRDKEVMNLSVRGQRFGVDSYNSCYPIPSQKL